MKSESKQQIWILGYQRGITRQGDNCDFQPRTCFQVTFLIVFGREKSRSGL